MSTTPAQVRLKSAILCAVNKVCEATRQKTKVKADRGECGRLHGQQRGNKTHPQSRHACFKMASTVLYRHYGVEARVDSVTGDGATQALVSEHIDDCSVLATQSMPEPDDPDPTATIWAAKQEQRLQQQVPANKLPLPRGLPRGLRSLSTRHVLGLRVDSALHGIKIPEGMVEVIPKKVPSAITMPAVWQRLTDTLKTTPGSVWSPR